MAEKRKVEVFTAGCTCCDDAVELVRRIACSSCEISILDMKQEATARRAADLGVRRVPTVVIDGAIADCCIGEINEETLRTAGIGAAYK